MTYTNNVYASTTEATASISINKNKVKSYSGNFYLQDGQEFQIELFNPTQKTKLAQISMNGALISTRGIVLKPGQRVYLDRFIDTPKKFKFETYEVDLTDGEVLKAIANNGDIQVSFFDEKNEVTYDTYITPVFRKTIFGEPMYQTSNCFNSTVGCQNISATLSSTGSMPTMDSLQETGRVEQGRYSNQEFTYYSGQFNTWASNTVYMKILPVSKKPFELQDLANYCQECGTKNKGNSYKYCPVCGTKF